MSETTVTADTIVNEAVKQFPQTLYIFKIAGIDTCCGGALPIGEAAKRHGQDTLGEAGRAQIRNVARSSPSGAPR